MTFSTVTRHDGSPCKVGLGTLHCGREVGTRHMSWLSHGSGCYLKLQDPNMRLMLDVSAFHVSF